MDIHTVINMNRLQALFVAILLPLISLSQEIIYEKDDSLLIEEIIKKHSAGNTMSKGDRVISIAEEFYGTRYAAGTLEMNDNEPLFISCRKFDCTTFIETVLALSITDKNDAYDTFCTNLEKIRYRNGVRNGYTSRLHYMSWWIADSAKSDFISEIYTPAHTAEQLLELNFMSRHPEKYRNLKESPENTRILAEYENISSNRKIKYIPKSNVATLSRKEIRNGDVIAIVTGIAGLDVSHVGFAHWHNDKLHMIHASSMEQCVISDSVPLAEYLKERKSHKGIRIFRVH